MTVEIVTRAAEASLKKFESDQIARFKRLSTASANIISAKAFAGSKADVAAFTTALKPLENALNQVNLAGAKVGDGLGTSTRKARAEVDPLDNDIKRLTNSVYGLRNATEATDGPIDGAIRNFRELKTESLGLAQGLDTSSKQYRQLTQVAATAERSLATLEGRQTKLGFSANALVGINRSVIGQLGQFGPVGNAAAAGFDTFGGAMVGIPTLAGGVATGVLAITAATAALVKQGIPELKTYQEAMNILAASGETDLGRFKGELEALQEVGGKAAQSFSRSQLAGALAETVKAGTTADEAMRLLRTSTQLASAESQDLGDSTALVLQNLRQYGLGVEEAARAGDALAAAGNLAAGTTTDLSTGLATVGPVAKAAGLSLEETLGILVNLDNKGLSAAETGATGLRTVLAALADPTAEARDVLRGLGVSLENADGSARSASEVLNDLKEALQGNEEAMASAAKIFDSQGVTTILALDDSTQKYTDTIQGSQGALNAYAAQMANGLAPAQDRARAAMADLSSTAAEVFAPALASTADGLNRLLTNIDNFVTGGSAGVSTILGIAKAIGDSSDTSSLLGAAEALEKKLSGSAQESVQGLIADLQAGVRPTEEIAAALLELGESAVLGPLERDISVARGRVEELTDFLEKAQGQNYLQNLLTVGSPEELRRALAQAEEDLRQAEAAAIAAQEQLDGITGAAQRATGATGELSEALQDAQTEVANTLESLDFGSYNEAYIRLAIENPEQLLAQVQTQFDNTQFELGVNPSPELEGELAKWQALLEVVRQLVAAQEEAAAVPSPAGGAPDPGPFDAATASINRLNEERARLEEEFSNAPGGSALQRSLGEQIAAIDETIGGYNELTQTAGELTDAQIEAAIGATKAGDAAETQAGRVSLAVNAYADVGEAISVIPKAYASVTAAVDISNKAFANVKGAVDIGVKAYATVTDAVDVMVDAYATVPDAVEIPIPDATAVLAGADAYQDLKTVLAEVGSVTAQTKDIIGQTDFSQLTEGGPEAVQDYLGELNKLIILLRQLEQTNPKMFNALGGAQALADLEALVSGVEDVAGGMIDAAKAADTLSNALDIFGALTEGALDLAEALGADVEELDTVAKGVLGLGSALQKALSGDIIGAITTAIGTLFDVIVDGIDEANRKLAESGDAVEKYGLEWLKANGYIYYDPNAGFVVDTAALAEYEQYLAAIEERGQAVADKYVTIDEQGKVTFNEEAFAEAEQGLDRLADTADRYREKLDEIKDAVDSVNEAELEAKQLTLDAKIEGQDGAYSVEDIFAQQEIDIAEAAQRRDSAYHEAFKLEQAGYADLAARRRAAADEAYQAEISMINEGATDRAEAIGANNGEFQSALQQNGAEAEQYYQDYWNDDTNAQIAAQASAREQLRRQQAVMNSQRYTDLLNAGYTEQEAYRLAAEGLGYQIDATTQDLVTQQEQAGVAQGQAATNAGNTAATGITTGWAAAVGAVISGGSSLNTTLASTQGVASSLIAGLFGNTGTAVATQGGALASVFSGTYANISQAVFGGASGLNTTLTNGANLNLGAISSVTNALGGAIVGGGNALAKAELDKANQLIKQKQEGAKKEAGAEISNGNELNKVVTSVSDLKIAQIKAATDAQSNWIGKAFDGLIGQVIAGNKGLADAWSGKGTHWSGSSKTHWSSGMTGGMTKLFQDAFKGNFNSDWAKPIDPNKFAEQQEKKLNGGKGGSGTGKGGSKGSSGGKGSGSSGGKKDGSSYTGGGSKEYPQGSPGWYEARMREIDEQIKKTASPAKIRQLQAQRDKLKAAYDKLMGEGTKADPKAPAGSINEIEERLSKAREAFENATTDAARAQAAERIKVLEAELKEKRKLLEDSAKDVQDAVKGTVISIESPIADLGTLAYLAEQVSSATARIPTSVASASSAGAASITRLPESYTPSILPAYQEQMNITTQMGGHVDRFGGHIDRFGAIVTRMERLERGARSTSELPGKARGQGLSTFTLR